MAKPLDPAPLRSDAPFRITPHPPSSNERIQDSWCGSIVPLKQEANNSFEIKASLFGHRRIYNVFAADNGPKAKRFSSGQKYIGPRLSAVGQRMRLPRYRGLFEKGRKEGNPTPAAQLRHRRCKPHGKVGNGFLCVAPPRVYTLRRGLLYEKSESLDSLAPRLAARRPRDSIGEHVYTEQLNVSLVCSR